MEPGVVRLQSAAELLGEVLAEALAELLHQLPADIRNLVGNRTFSLVGDRRFKIQRHRQIRDAFAPRPLNATFTLTAVWMAVSTSVRFI
jgi:hypothetical protein